VPLGVLHRTMLTVPGPAISLLARDTCCQLRPSLGGLRWGENPAVHHELQATLRLSLGVRGTEAWVQGLPVSVGQALGMVNRMRPTWVVPPPRDLVALLVDDLTDPHGEEPGSGG